MVIGRFLSRFFRKGFDFIRGYRLVLRVVFKDRVGFRVIIF